MAGTADDWTDADFIPRQGRSFEEIAASLPGRVAAGDFGPDVIDDLRLFALVRLSSGRSQRETEDEMTGWGVPSRFAVDLVCSTRTAGRIGPMVIGEELLVNGISTGFVENPAYRAKARAADRAERLARRAVRMAGGGTAGADLGFTPDELPTRASRPRPARGRAALAVVVGLAAVGGLIVAGMLLTTRW